ncbi:ABC transporter ATP-binding protein [Paenibacillus chitinolyticus]|uniref:ABC transporter ATP-binding protein n=1 Tax=Paenibacillus chitinolyticus TaxID=79263 RepID=UPI0036DA5CB1
MLQIKGLKKSFGKREVLQEINVDIGTGVTGVLGPNGAGKTTLFRILATIYEPTQGEIKLDEWTWKHDLEKIRELCGYLPQHVGLFPSITVYEYLEYVGQLRKLTDSKKRRQRIDQVLQEVNLESKRNDKIKKLSGGMKQRLGIAQAILHEPKLLLIDEPTAGLDPEERLRFRSLLRQQAQHRVILLSTHITEDVAMTCDRVCMMKNGHLDFYNSLANVTQLAEDRVWSMELTPDEFMKIRDSDECRIVATSETGGRLSVRVLANQRPVEHANPADPSLEEGYMIWLSEN